MACKTEETTNGRIAQAKAIVAELIEWARADEDHARENGARTTAKDDRRRARNLEKALGILELCER